MRRFKWSCDATLGYPLRGGAIDFDLGNAATYSYYYVWAALALILVVCACIGLWRQFIGRADLPVGQDDGSATCQAPTGSPESIRGCATADYSLFASVTLLLAAIGFPIFFWRAQMPMQSWYLLPFMGLAVVCFDGGRPAFPGVLRLVFLALVAGTALLSGLGTANLLSRHFSNVNIFARELEQEASPEDYVLVHPWNWGITFNYYYKGATPWDTVPPLSDHSVHRVDLVLAQMENDTNALAPVFAKISQTLKSGHRVWFLGVANMRLPVPGTPPPAPLPLPPLKYSGWSESPYSSVWCTQTIQFLTDHSVKFGEFKLSSSDIYLTENMDVYVADGWTNSIHATAP
jgi:hypothetical protein